MSSYGYAPPPPPPPSQSSAGYQYQASYQQSAQQGRGGRGGHHSSGRAGGDYQPAPRYGYDSQAPQGYGQPVPYAAPPSQHGSYPPHQQQWSHDPAPHSHAQPHQPPHQPQHTALPPQNYHPNYAPQMYHQQGPSHSHHQSAPAPVPYSQQPPYAPPGPPQQSYGQPYSHASPSPTGHPSQKWGPPAAHGQPGGSRGGHYGGRGRGGGGYHDRGSKTQMMGPPIRIGFESGSPQGPGPSAPVSSGYSQQAPYAQPPGGPAPPHGSSSYSHAPYQPYASSASPPAAGPSQYDPYYNQSSRPFGRGGFQGNSYRGGRPHFGGDKIRHKKTGGPPAANAPPHHHQKPDAASAGKKKKRKTNTLGLTPGEESDDEEVDEEAKLVEMIGPDAPNPTDIAAWIEQRRKNFPTQARAKARQAASAEADVAGKSGASGVPSKNGAPALTALERQQQKAEKLRKQLEKVESSIKRKREQQDEGDEMRDVDDGSSEASSDSKSDDEAPETLPVRSEAIPPPSKKADPTKHCKYYSTGGTCGKKGKCRFVHDPAVREAALQERERNGGRMTLQQRLILNDKDQEDLTIVKTLQYLKEKGMMKPGDAPAVSSTAEKAGAPSAPSSEFPLPLPPHANTAAAEASLPVQPPSSLLPPPPPPSLHAANSGPTVRYQGWNLSGFGNTGVKSADV